MASPVLTAEALAAKRARGERTGSIPLGMRLDVDGVRLLPDHDERAVIGEVRRMRSAGMSIRAIAADLNARGVAARGARWHPTTVARLLGGKPTTEAPTPPADSKAPR
jgi:hypothetical protein